jgi:hypothetical protein
VSSRLAAACSLLALVSLFFGPVAHAEGAQRDTTPADSARDPSAKAEAKSHFERGMLLAQTANNWDAALKEFLISRATFPTKSATRNAAFALVQLGRNAEAFELYTRLLEEFSREIEPNQLAIDVAAMRTAENRTGLIEVRGNEPGIRIVVDGVQRGTTPEAGLIRLDEGEHTLRLSKDGFETFEQQVSTRGGERAVLNASLQPLRETGLLVVREANGQSLDVAVDGASVGKAPWSGNVSPGTHLVVLRGTQNWGSEPSSAAVEAAKTTTLTLRAEQLDAELRVEPAPSYAAVSIDGVAVGNGIWTGRMPSGSHWIEVDAPGHLPVRREAHVPKLGREVIDIALQRDLSSPLWHLAGPQLYVEGAVGALLAHTLHGTADDSCRCDTRARPLGEIAAARLGYLIVPGLGLELTAGYLSISESMTRHLTASGELGARYSASDYHDTTSLSGPLAALGASYRAFKRATFTARANVGLAVLNSNTTNSGTFSGIGNSGAPFSSSLIIPELERQLLTPFGSTELRLGYRFTKHLSADVGVALLIFVPQNASRTGANNFSDDGERVAPVPPNSLTHVDVLTLPRENVAGAFLSASPSAAARFDF